MSRAWGARVAVASTAVLLTGCATVPADPDGTLERVQGGVLRVGVTENAPWVELSDGGDPSGTEPALILEFAERLDAEVEWTPGSEATLAEALEALEAGELDLVIGGFVEDTPWTELAASTRPYVEAGTPEGNDKHVMLAPLGENAFLVTLETFLDEQAVS